MIRAVFIGLWLWCLSNAAFAHEVRPALLKIDETAPGAFTVTWKQPVLGGKRLKLTPKFPELCAQTTPQQTLSAGSVIETSRLKCALDSGKITIEGLDRTLTDVFVQIIDLEGKTRHFLLKPHAPTAELGGGENFNVGQYLGLGIEHILLGWDHILFVLGLALLVRPRQVWGVATAFTLAHSLTLMFAALGWLFVPSRPVEILIALSIVFLGVEVARKLRGGMSLTTRRPYLVSFMIGLLHGCGFAGALNDIGLPQGAELVALLLFNIGIELGQFAIIAVFVTLLWGFARRAPAREKQLKWVTTYAISALAMYWVIERTSAYWL